MCEYLIHEDNNCKLKLTTQDGSKPNPQMAQEINRTFVTLSEQRNLYNKAKIGTKCSGPRCCFNNSDFVKLIDCPYYKE